MLAQLFNPIIPVCVLVGLLLLWQGMAYIIALLQRSATERIVVSQIAGVLRQNLPLAMAVSLAGESERGMARLHLKRISRFLSQGASLSEAIELGYRECSPLVVSLAAAGEKAGRLTAAFEQAEEYLIRKAHWRRLFDIPAGTYVTIVLLFASLLVSGIMVAVVPKFKQIFLDFGTRLPPLTITLIDISEWFVTGTPPGWIVVALLLVLWAVSRFWRVGGRSLSSKGKEFVHAHVPGLRRMEFGRCMAEMLRLTRIALASGMDLSSAVRLSADLRVNAYVSNRMRRLADLLEEGTGPVDACREAGLGPVLATALAAGVRSGDMDAALRYAADYHEAIVVRWWIFLSAFIWPLCTVMLGCIVGFVVLALFLPLVTLINSVSYGWANG
jgi:type IV pilus assembly protein PilC